MNGIIDAFFGGCALVAFLAPVFTFLGGITLLIGIAAVWSKGE